MDNDNNEERAGSATTQKPAQRISSTNDSTKGNKKSTAGRGRTRNFATLVYPESAPSDWMEILGSEHVPALVSPLHDKDMDGKDKTKLKKAHYHVLLMYEGVKTQEQVKQVLEKIGGVGLEHVGSLRGYARYLVHADNPEKYQYNINEVRAFGGADYDAVTHLPTDDIKEIREMMTFIRVNRIHSFAQFADICAEEHPEWFKALVLRSTYFIKEYIKSLTWEEIGGMTDGEKNSN